MTRIEALVKPHMLKWARERSGFDLFGAAKRIGVKPERLVEWEKGTMKPTINQALKMAEKYRRPLSLFYLDEPPEDFQVAMKDFRTFPAGLPGVYSPGLLLEHRNAVTRRNLVIDLLDDASAGAFSYVGAVTTGSDPEKVGQKIRQLLNIEWKTQKKWKDEREALNWWRESIEKLNVLVFHTNHQGIIVEMDEARGFSISEPLFPVIVLNSKDSFTGRIFTLIHESVHLMLNQGGVCDCREYAAGEQERSVEIFCNHAAGAVLVPFDILMNHKVVKEHRAYGKRLRWEEREIKALSFDFSVSNEALLRRLLIFGLTSSKFYEEKREEYIERWEKIKSDGEKKVHPPYFRMKLRQIGKPCARVVFAAYYDRKITLSDVMDYIGVKARSLRKIENAAYSVAVGI
jgi:Zn-dependent peptidase ImmA (M78 family)/DNA-binding XRE family transcriptional regulator